MRFNKIIAGLGLLLGLLTMAGGARAVSTTYAITDSHIVIGGPSDTTQTVGGHAAWCLATVGKISFSFTGSTLDVQGSLVAGGNPYTCSVDGGATYQPNLNASYGTTRLYPTSGTGTGTDTTHTITIQMVTPTTSVYYGIDSTNSFIVGGAAPALSYYPDYGVYYHLNSSTFTSLTTMRTEGVWTPNIAGGNFSGATNKVLSVFASDACLRFNRKCSGVKIWCYQNNTEKFRLYQDGVAIGSTITAGNGPTVDWLTIAATGTLDNTTEHEYSIYCGGTDDQNPNLQNILTDVMFVGDAGAVTPLSILPTWVFYTDSIGVAYTGTNGDNSQGFEQKLGSKCHITVYNVGLIGRTVRTLGALPANDNSYALAGETAAAQATLDALTSDPAEIFVELGTNDMAQIGEQVTTGTVAINSTSVIVATTSPSNHAFTAGQTITIDTGGAIETRVISAVPDGTHLTLTSSVSTAHTNVAVTGVELLSEFQTSYGNMLTRITAHHPTSKIICLGILNRYDGGGSQSLINTWSTAIVAAIAGQNNSKITYWTGNNILNILFGVSGAQFVNDNLHPNDAGYTAIYQYITSKIANSFSNAITTTGRGRRLN